jgi:hypothetical protein
MIFDWLRRRKVKQFEEWLKVKEEHTKLQKLQDEAEERNLKEAAAAVLEQRERLMKTSGEPYVKLESADIGSNGEIRFKLDWNDAFVNYLRKECGFVGDEERVIQQYLGALYREMYEDSKTNALDVLRGTESRDSSNEDAPL